MRASVPQNRLCLIVGIVNSWSQQVECAAETPNSRRFSGLNYHEFHWGIVVNTIRELDELAGLFPEPDEQRLYLRAEHVAKEATPEPYHHMLVHEHHMTVSMESWHNCSVDVDVLASRFENGLYLRKIVLRKGGTPQPVQFGYVRFNLELVTPQVRHEILEEKVPLGRVLIQHNVFRHVDLGAILRFTAGPGLERYLHMQPGDVTYGRLATIFCNGIPAIDLLEIAAPLSS